MINNRKAHILILGLEDSIRSVLRLSLAELGYAVFVVPFLSAPDSVAAIDRVAADLVFCTADRPCFEALLATLRAQGRSVPVVVASRIPEVDVWLDALDAGAYDYCAAPFEPRLIAQLVNGAIEYRCRLPVAV